MHALDYRTEQDLSCMEAWLKEKELWCVTGRYRDSERFPLAFSACPKEVWKVARELRHNCRAYGCEADGLRRRIYAMRLEIFREGNWQEW